MSRAARQRRRCLLGGTSVAAGLVLALLGGCADSGGPGRLLAKDQGAGDQRLDAWTEAGLSDGSSPLAASVELSDTDGKQKITSVALIYDAPSFVVLWEEIPEGSMASRLRFARVSPLGELLALPTTLEPPPATMVKRLQLFVVPEGYLAWYRGNEQGTKLYAQRLDSEGRALEGPQALADISSTGKASPFGLAFTGQSFGLCWENIESSSSTRQIFFKQVDLELVDLSEPRVLASSNDQQIEPYLTWQPDTGNGGAFVALWIEQAKLWAASFAGEGTSFLAEPQPLGDWLGDVRTPQGVTLDDSTSLVWWVDDASYNSRLFAPISGAAAVFAEPLALLPANRYESIYLAGAAQGQRLLLAWQSTSSSILPQIVVATLEVSDWQDRASWPSGPSEGQLLSDSRFFFDLPAVAASPDGFGVVFVGRVEGSERLYFRLVE